MKKLILTLLLPLLSFTAMTQQQAVVHIKTDSYPGETKWTLYKDAYQGDTIAYVPYGHYTQGNTMNSDTIYIADSITDISFVIYDSYGDGIVNGEYYVSICEDTVINYPVSTFTTGLIHNRTVPQCMPNPPPGNPGVPARVVINLDQYQSETSWDIKDTNGIIYASGGNYNAEPDYGTVVKNVIIPKGDLEFTIYDSYGDGLNGSLWQGQDGSYYIIQCNDTLVYGTDPAFGNDTTHTFVSDSCPPIPGCLDPSYIEYNPFATVSDSSCSVLKIFGCIDSTMYNYDSSANTMDMIDSCDYTLVLHDLMGNGWVGSKLTIYADDTTDYYHTGGFTEIYNIPLKAPRPITARFFVTSQASLTTIECGFTLINPEGDTLISVQPPFIQPLLPYTVITNCGNTCEEKTFGCTDSIAVNYIDSVNTDDGSCYYNPGCMNPLYLEYDSTADYDNGSCNTLIVLGCMDSTALNYNPNANVEIPGSCITIVYGCMNPLAFNYNPNANVDDSTCVPIIEGCMNPTALNYDSTANTDDGSCILPIYGCTDSTAFNYSPSANVDDSSCVEIVYGCMDVTMFNYNPLANIDNGSCEPFVYGCMDSTMFNFNPLANADNNTCVPFIYGCTDPSMLNYNPNANTEDFTCIPFIYGCMDSTALNYDSTANTDNGSCIEVVEGCMDSDAYTYNSNANLNNSDSCFYDAGCITGAGNPYWLNDPCYAWVIEVDEYCCENEWDTVCQYTYNYCEGTWTGPLPKRFDKQLLMITDILGRPARPGSKQVLFFIYSDGTVEKKYTK
tara:strand:+ start:38631 stop:40985 length:2355 start_codon:yes stop_codon:yes gene_type:complete